MKSFLKILFLVGISIQLCAAKKYFVVLSEPLSLESNVGYSSLSKGSLTGSASTKKIASVFSGDDLKGIKLFTTFGEKDLKVSVKSTGNVTELSKEDPMQYVYIVQLEDEDVDAFLDRVKQLETFRYFEPNRLFRPFASPTTEPRYDLYQKSNIELMKLNHVWSSSSGVGTRIAIIDTGINANHEEFCDGAAIVSGVIVSTQSMDVSACSAIDTPFDAVTEGTPGQGDFVGYGTVSGTDYEFADTYPNDEDGHGSHVAGIAGARVNDRGIAGTAYNSTIIPIRVMASYYGRINGELKVFSTGTLEWIIAGINYAVTNNADVINMSLGITNESVVNIGLLKTTIDNAVAKGVLVVAAAGNESIDFDENQVAPACIDSAMSVASVSYLGQVTSYSNFGETLDVAAVGGDTGSCIYSVGIGSSTAYYQSCGTSMAAPYVAGYAALIKSYYKNNKGQTLTPAEIRRLIQLTASNSSNRNETLGYGIIDAQEAFLYAGAITSTDSTDLFYSADLTNALACYPNPFYQTSASNTSCVFNLSKASSGKYSIYSRRGQRVYYGEQGYATGQSTFTWNGKDSMGQSLPNGVYQLVFSFSPNDGSSAITKKHLISLLR